MPHFTDCHEESEWKVQKVSCTSEYPVTHLLVSLASLITTILCLLSGCFIPDRSALDIVGCVLALLFVLLCCFIICKWEENDLKLAFKCYTSTHGDVVDNSWNMRSYEHIFSSLFQSRLRGDSSDNYLSAFDELWLFTADVTLSHAEAPITLNNESVS